MINRIIKPNRKIIIKFVQWLGIVCSIFSIACVSLKAKTTNLLLDSEYEKYYAFRDVALVNTNITKELVVNGELSTTNSKLNKVSLNGEGTITNSVVNDDISINGKLTLDKSVVRKNLMGNGELIAKHSQITKIEMEAKSIILNDTVVGSILVKRFKNTTIYLRKDSVVTGNIVFATGTGRVIIDKESRVKGSITGAVVKQDVLEVKVGAK